MKPFDSTIEMESPVGTRSLLRLASAGLSLALPIEHVREILQITKLTPLPRTPAFIRGVMNMRGAVVPVVDLSSRLGRGVTEMGKRTCIVVVDTEFGEDATALALSKVGILVDTVYEVFDSDAPELEPTPMFGTELDGHYLDGLSRHRGLAIPVLALSHVLALPELRDAIGRHVTHEVC
jgi:purine-binding chemotaxis protein CheW